MFLIQTAEMIVILVEHPLHVTQLCVVRGNGLDRSVEFIVHAYVVLSQVPHLLLIGM